MQDSTITYRVTTTGIAEAEAKFNALGATIKNVTINQNGSVTATGNLSREQADLANSTARAAAATDKASKSQSSYFAHIAKTTIQSALVNKLFLGMVTAAGDAVKQVDLFNNFPASMAALGLSSKDASVALTTLRDYVAQVGGNLTTATTSVARFAEVTKNVKAATAEFVGVNNALIAGGAGAEVQSNALEQLIQAYSRGVPQLIEWRSLMVAMPAQLNQVAKAMNFTNAQALGEALTNGKVSMQDFVTELTKLSTGTGPIAQQAIARMQGIQFAANVMQNALTNGLAAIYQAVGRNNIIAFFNFLTQVIIVLSQWVVILINDLISLFNWISGVFGGPQISHFSGEAAGAADAIGAGAENANSMADGLGNAADNAAKINKSLASFDKMNVLPDKTSGSGGSGGTGGGGAGGVDPATAGALGDIFDGLGKKMQEISGWAKIFAGILAGILALKFGKALLKDFNDTIKTIQDANKNAKAFGNTLKSLGEKAAAAFKGQDTKTAESAGKGIGSAILNGLATAIGAGAKQIWKYLLVPLGGALAAGLSAIGVFVAGLVGVTVAAGSALAIAIGAIVVLIVAAVLFGIYLIWKNWDKIWSWMKDVAAAVWDWIKGAAKATADFFVGIWNGVVNFFKGIWNGIKAGFDAVWNFIKQHAAFFEILFAPLIFAVAIVIIVISALVAVFRWVFDQLVAIFSAAPGFFSGIFQAAWDFIVAIWNGVVAFFQAVWDGIVAVFSVVVAFYVGIFKAAWDAIVLIWTVVSGWFDTYVWQPLVTLFTPVVNFFTDLFTRAWDGIKAVWAFVSGFFSDVWTNVKNAFGDVAGWFAGVFQNAWNRITSVFSGLWYWFKTNVWDRIVSVFTTIGTVVGDAVTGGFKAVVNGVLRGVSGIWNGFINLLNGAINTINNIPGVNLPKVATWNPTYLAKGGIVNQPTLAMIGENGQEAVMPLQNNTEWIDTLASKLNSKQGNGQPVQLVVQIGEDKIATKIIDLINEKTQMSGRNAIYV